MKKNVVEYTNSLISPAPEIKAELSPGKAWAWTELGNMKKDILN